MNAKQTIKTSFQAITITACGLIALQTKLHAQENDWPCEQVFVKQISPAVIWPHPIDDASATRWKNKAALKPLASKIANQFTAGDEEIALIDQFLQGIAATDRSTTATDLFMATLNEFNLKRLKYLKGIQKFTRKQKGLASRLSALLEKRDNLAAQDPMLGTLDDEIYVAEQIFRNREGIMRDLCEHPVRIEENLGRVARAIAEHIEEE